jgi:hypothetical protein
MVVVVADPIFESSGRSGRLNAPDKAFGDQQAQSVVHRLKRDGSDLGPHGVGHPVGCDVRLTRYGPQDSQSLCGDLNSALTEKVSGLGGHGDKDRSALGLIQIF